MFTRVVDINTKPGKVRGLSKTIHDEILPILRSSDTFRGLQELPASTRRGRGSCVLPHSTVHPHAHCGLLSSWFLRY